MATLTITIVTGATTNSSKTFSSADAIRVFTAYQAIVQPGGTQQNLNDYIIGLMIRDLTRLVVQNETTSPAPPTFT